uniref:Uncharacterized protein n=1 Tax=Chelydra serpentina TaxID=8475 RepID=A0A8C3SSS0_CHESE
MSGPSTQTPPIIPKPRGKRAYYATWGFIVLCVFALYHMEQSWHHAAEFLTFYFTALQIGALLRGVCNFLEEIWHVQSSCKGIQRGIGFAVWSLWWFPSAPLSCLLMSLPLLSPSL